MLFTLALGASALAGGVPDWVVGAYRLELPAEVKTANQKLGIPEAYSRIMLRPDGTFTYASNVGGSVSAASGTYDLKENTITLVANDRFPIQNTKSLAGHAEGGRLDLDGLRYERVGTANVLGTWNVKSGNFLDRSISMTFKDNHTFEFAGMTATSKGRYEIEGDRLTLIWTEVDGEAVEVGTMRKTISVREDGFSIDTYRYVRP